MGHFHLLRVKGQWKANSEAQHFIGQHIAETNLMASFSNALLIIDVMLLW
jgi:hypothetical protein